MQAHAEPRGPGQKGDCGPHSALTRTLTQRAGNEVGVVPGWPEHLAWTWLTRPRARLWGQSPGATLGAGPHFVSSVTGR